MGTLRLATVCCACMLLACIEQPSELAEYQDAGAAFPDAASPPEDDLPAGDAWVAMPGEPAGDAAVPGSPEQPGQPATPEPEPEPATLPADAGPDAAPPEGPPTFVDVTEAAGLTYRQAPPRSEHSWYWSNGLDGTAPYFTGGAAAGDFDGDGFVDLYVTRLDKYGLLFRNLGDGTFEDVTVAAGLNLPGFRSVGALFADIDNDGDADLFVTTFGGTQHMLFVNEGGVFTEQAAARGAAVAGEGRRQAFSPSAGDYDRDGFLDLHSCEWQFDLVGDPPRPSHSRLLRNRGAQSGALAGHFEDVTVAAGVVLGNGGAGRYAGDYSFTSSFSDLDDDGWPDLIVAGDFGTSRLYWNRGDGTFEDGTAAAFVGGDENGMGSALGDFDGDGLIDWFVTSIACEWAPLSNIGCTGNRLYRNNGDRTFDDRTDEAGVRDGGWGWGTAAFDYDNDGDLDLVMENGINFPIPVFNQFERQALRLWRNDGDQGMTEVAAEAGLDAQDEGRGLLVLDYDRDGDLDLFVVRHPDGGRLYRNDGGNAHGFLRLRLVGADANRQAFGARVSVRVREGDAPQVRELRAGSNFLGQDEAVLHFGLGPGNDPVAEVRIVWPTPGARKVQVLRDVARNQLLTVGEP